MVVFALAVAACGDGGGEETASNSTEGGDPSTSVDGGRPATTARRQRARLPGPPGPSGPPGIITAVATWHDLLEAGVTPAQCRRLLDSVRGELGKRAAAETGGEPYVLLYRGIAEGCLGQLQAARNDLGQARARQVGLGPDDTSRDTTCNAQLLLAFGFDNFLDQQISPVCPRPTTTEDTPDETTSTTRRTTTTRASTTTTR